ncbi:hypothetical protein ALC56_07588 [Trachymyrmex septentrionalis]|uniref:Uncharacterized protein n=1 Tax=Trachymyrmex septentrionalis TaxID=34720 RepID=A0A195FD46_9HYME|nr:hypothetical protein ALC56_07588 [Trachymyrmex septentrionalis]
MPTFREPCSPLHQGEEQRYQAALRPDEVDCKVHETLAFQELIWTRRKPAKRITFTIFVYQYIYKRFKNFILTII